MRRTYFLLLISCIIPVLLLSACGGSDDDGGLDGDEMSPEEICFSRGGDWQAGQCCLAATCGKIHGSLICSKQGGGGRWLEAGGYVGRIVNLGCGEAVSSGAWHKCGGFNIASVTKSERTHQYLCIGSTIYECTGEEGPFSDRGNRDNTGKAREKGGATYYCTQDFTWDTDLDKYGCLSCERAGFVCTADDPEPNKCCSEVEDQPSEYYNDVGGTGTRRGACWGSKHMDDGFFPTESDPKNAFEGDTLVVKGEFFGCKIGDAETGRDNAALLALADSHTGEQLIQNQAECEVLQDAKGPTDFFCSVNGVWKESGGAEPYSHQPRVIKEMGWPAEEGDQLTECCRQLDCWTGTECVENQKRTAREETYNGLRCVDGIWGEYEVKRRPNGFGGGYCAETTDCLVNEEGKSENDYNPDAYFFDHPTNDPQCLASGQFYSDNYCDAGSWGTRTEIVAYQLLDIAEKATTSFELFCSSYEDTLNHVQYPIAGVLAEQYITATCAKGTQNVPCVNNFCVVQFDGNIAYGTTLNHPIDGSKSFLRALGEENTLCAGITGDGFKRCGDSNIFYNDAMQAIIVDPTGKLETATSTALKTSYRPKLTAKKTELNTFAGTLTTDTDLTFFTEYGQMRNIYYATLGEKAGFAIYDPQYFDRNAQVFRGMVGLQFENIVIQDEFGIDACDLMRQYHTGAGEDPALAQLHCETNGKLNAISFGTGTQFPLGAAWSDLTAKLRLRTG